MTPSWLHLIAGRVDLVPSGRNNPDRPLWGGQPQWITIHETGNERIGANAEMHRLFVHHGGGLDQASFHAVADDRESIQLLPWTNVGYHIGDGDGGAGNNTSIGIELCVNQDGDFGATVNRGARLTAALMQAFELPIKRVRQHGSWPGERVHHGCPATLQASSRGYTWDAFIRLVAKKFVGEA